MDELIPSSVDGLPFHPLVVHAAIVLVPLAAIAVLLTAVVPRLRRWAGPVPLLLALAALVVTPVASSSGENLAGQLAAAGKRFDVTRHAELGGLLVWWVVPLFLVALATYVVGRRDRRTEARPAAAGVATGGGSSAAVASVTPRWLAAGLAMLAVVLAVGAIVQVVLIGHSGAGAVWDRRLG